MNKDLPASVFKGLAAALGILVIVLNSVGALTPAAGMALLSILLATLSGLTIGSMLKN